MKTTLIDSAMILAAGMGTRMRPLTLTMPKPLVEVAGKSLLQHSLDRAAEAGIKNKIINIHAFPDQMQTALSDQDVFISDETDKLLETGGGIKRAIGAYPHQLGTEAFYTINSDSIWIGNNPLEILANYWQPKDMDALLLLLPVNNAVNYTRAGDFFLTDGNQLIRRGKKPSAPYVFTGIQIIKPSVFDDAPDDAFSLNFIWDKLLDNGRLYGTLYSGNWADVGTPEGTTAAEIALAAE